MLVLGPSGSGKSTLTLCLDGLIPHLIEGDYVGEVVVAGLVAGQNPVHLLTQETGLVFQDPDTQFCTLTVEDEIAFGLENLRREPSEIEEAIDTSLDAVGLVGFRGRALGSLSGGEKQRVAIASVLAMGPRVLVLDEPSANLDPQATSELFGLLRDLAADCVHTLVIIEHKLDQVVDWVDSVLVLSPEGTLLYSGDARQAFHDRAADLEAAGVWRPQTAELVQALRRAGWDIGGRPLGVRETAVALATTPGLLTRLRVERPAPAPVSTRTGADGGVGGAALLKVEHLSFRYPDGHLALDDVSLSIERGEFLALVGENGAGKTTLASLLSGVLDAPARTVFLEGADVAGMPAWAVSEQVGYVFQNPEHQFVADTAFGELAFSLSPGRGRRQSESLNADQRGLVESWLERLGLLPLAEANPFSLSQGQKRRLSVAAMLIRGQAALILDEPTLGQDELQSDRLMSMMQGLRSEGRAIVMVTHDMRLVSEYADRVLVLGGGSVLFQGVPTDLFSRPDKVREAGLEMPSLGMVAALLREEHGVQRDLHTIAAFVSAVGPGPDGWREQPTESDSRRAER